MPDPIDETLAELGLDTPDPQHLATLWSSLLAEPDVLSGWARTSTHPRLAAAYHALHQRVGARSEEVRPHVEADLGTTLTASTTDRTAHEAHNIELELSRLKWLLANRETRNAAADALGPHYDHAADAEEAEVLRELLQSAGRGLC